MNVTSYKTIMSQNERKNNLKTSGGRIYINKRPGVFPDILRHSSRPAWHFLSFPSHNPPSSTTHLTSSWALSWLRMFRTCKQSPQSGWVCFTTRFGWRRFFLQGASAPLRLCLSWRVISDTTGCHLSPAAQDTAPCPQACLVAINCPSHSQTAGISYFCT